MLLRDLMNKMSSVMVFRLYLVDNDGIPVDDDIIDYINQEHHVCDQQVDTYGEWYVEEIFIDSIIKITVSICPIDREED